MSDYRTTLRRIAVRDETIVEWMQAEHEVTSAVAKLDYRVCGLVRIAALIAAGGSVPSYRRATDLARLGGATSDEIVAVLAAVAPTVGVDRSVAEAPKIALALGYDVDEALDH